MARERSRDVASMLARVRDAGEACQGNGPETGPGAVAKTAVTDFKKMIEGALK